LIFINSQEKNITDQKECVLIYIFRVRAQAAINNKLFMHYIINESPQSRVQFLAALIFFPKKRRKKYVLTIKRVPFKIRLLVKYKFSSTQGTVGQLSQQKK